MPTESKRRHAGHCHDLQEEPASARNASRSATGCLTFQAFQCAYAGVVFLGKLLCLAFLRAVFMSQKDRMHGSMPRLALPQRSARTQAATEVAAQADAELGTLEPIRPRPSLLGAYLIGNASLYYTSNPSLSNDGGRGDLYFVGGGGARHPPELGRRTLPEWSRLRPGLPVCDVFLAELQLLQRGRRIGLCV